MKYANKLIIAKLKNPIFIPIIGKIYATRAALIQLTNTLRLTPYSGSISVI